MAKKFLSYGVGIITHTFNAIKGLYDQAIGAIGFGLKGGHVFLRNIPDGVYE